MATRKQVTRQDVLAAAMELIEESGAEAFSLRGLALHLGITSPSVQWHVGSREQLLVDIVDAIIQEIPLPPQEDFEPADWLRLAASAVRAHLYLRRPALVPLVRDYAALAPAVVGLEYEVAVALARAGLGAAALQRAHAAFFALVLGFVYAQAARDAARQRPLEALHEAMERKQAELIEVYPDLRNALATPAGEFLADLDDDELFTGAVNALLDGLFTGLPQTHNASLK